MRTLGPKADLHPTSQGEALETIAQIYSGMGEYDLALAHFEKACHKGAPPYNIKQDIINVYLEKGDLDRAEALIKELTNTNVRRGSTGITFESLQARFYLLKGNYAQSIQHYNKLLLFFTLN